jgi:hypothetical protein
MLLITGCGTSAVTRAGTAPQPSATASLPAGCASALRLLPSSPPATAQEAADETTALGGRKGTTLDAMMDEVAADASSIGMDLDTGAGNVTRDVATYESDVAALRGYCR